MMNLDMDGIRADSAKSEEGGNFELWTEETVDIETPFSNLPQDDVEYLKLEIAELKQILIALAEKYKLSEDKRKVAERRNSFLKADNLRLQQMSDTSLSQKIEAEIESRRTLDKLREFIDFKQEFEKQAELLKKIISHLPRMKNAATCTQYEMVEKSEQCSGDGNILTENDLALKYNDPYYKHSDTELYNALDIESTRDTFKQNGTKINDKIIVSPDILTDDGYFEPTEAFILNENPVINESCDKIQKETNKCKISHMAISIRDNLQQEKLSQCNTVDYQNEKEGDVRAWDPKVKKESTSLPVVIGKEMKLSKSKIKLSKLKQELLALKNLNEWKSTDLDYKNKQLAVKNRELLYAKKEITQLKMRVNRLLIEQQKRPSTSCVSTSHTKIELKSKPEKTNKSHQRDSSRTKISTSKIKIPTDENPNKRKQINSETNVRSEMNVESETSKLPVSTETVWQEIAPGDQVRIKIKKASSRLD